MVLKRTKLHKIRMLKRWQPHSYTATEELLAFGKPTKPELPRTIRCLVWNILKAKRRQWAADFHHLTADRDLVLLQEAVADAPSDPMFYHSQRYAWLMARSFRHPVSGITNGVKTGSVAPSTDAKFFLSPHTEPVFRTQKSMLVTRYTVRGHSQSLLVLNMHAINFVTVAKFRSHIAQVGEAIGEHTGPVLLAGDFNTWRPARQHQFNAMTQELGLEQAEWPRRARLQHLRQHLDHVYFRGLQPVHVESLDFISSSDHKPIAVTFRL